MSEIDRLKGALAVVMFCPNKCPCPTCLSAIRAIHDNPVWPWIPITERRPEDGQKIILACDVGDGKYELAAGQYFRRTPDGSGKYCLTSVTNGKNDPKLTHWMPMLPVPAPVNAEESR